MAVKEKNFISAIVYLSGTDADALFLERVYGQLDAHFERFELVAVDNACGRDAIDEVKAWAAGIAHPLTILHMSMVQGREQCMNAGLDAAIGDYVYEFDSTEMPYSEELIYGAYEKAMEGNDIVSVCPSRMQAGSRWFYNVFNRNSGSSYQLRSSAFRLVTRRAINRVHATSSYLPYRKAAYAASGLRICNLEFEGHTPQSEDRMDLAVNSLILYTGAGTKVSFGIAAFMFLVTLLVLVYTVVIFLTGHPVEGWTTTMLIISVSFTGLFGLITIMIKYLSLLTDMIFKGQKYSIEGIEKIQK